MAEKGFGVKEINLIGASGTPTITSPNNINLNAANVAISTNVSVGGTMTVTGGGSFGIGSTVGIGSTLYVSHGDLYLRDNHQLNINNDALTMRGNNGGNGFITNAIGNLIITSLGDIQEDAVDNFSVKTNTTEQAILATKNGSVALYHDGGNKKIETSSSGVTITGTAVATSFSGSGANLTGIAVTEAPVTDYTVTANGSSAYRFHGGGVDETADDPDLYLIRGQKYRFNNTTGSSHPFALRVSSGGSAYTDGVTGSQNGIQFFTVPYSAPASLVYQCTVHSGMVGNIYIRGGTGENSNVGKTLLNTTAVTNTNDQLTVTRAASSFGEMSMTVDANTSTGTHANAFIFTKSKNTYWSGLGFQSSHGHIGAIVGKRDSAGGDSDQEMRIEIGGTGINASEEKTWNFKNNGNLSISDGDLVLASGHGIDFSATSDAGNSASMGSERLDDYEEGSWTPHLVSSAGNMSTTSFSFHQGTYTKIGRLVYITGVMYGPRSSGGTGNLRISNLPYTVRNGDHAQLLTKDYQFSNYPSNFGHISGYGMNNASQIQLFKREGTSQAGLPLSWWSTSANDYLYFNLTYTTDT